MSAAQASAIADETIHSLHPDWSMESFPQTDSGESFERILCPEKMAALW